MAEPERKQVSLDNPTIRALAKTDPELFLQRYAPPVLIDEVQYAPELFPYIKIIVDKNKRPGDFWLTGSQMFSLMENVTETLAGRVGIIPMLGLSNSEIRGNLSRGSRYFCSYSKKMVIHLSFLWHCPVSPTIFK